jgi:serine/threonine-protein kinase HipA
LTDRSRPRGREARSDAGIAIEVYVDETTTGESPVLTGMAYLRARRGQVSTDFSYGDTYQNDPRSWEFSVDLPMTSQRSHVPGLPGAFADCAPDRWGRSLITKRLRAEARAEHRTMPTITDIDYLLGVSDITRQGALRFSRRSDGDPQFLGPDPGIPKLIELPRLLQAADVITQDSDGDQTTALKVLLEAGSASLGGARPKASVRDAGQLFLAKFPHRSDEWDVMGWEKTVLDLAERAGIETPARQLHLIGGRPTLLLLRFDRTTSGRRVAYQSAMSLLQAADGDPHDYLEVAEALMRHSAAPHADLLDLWRRIVFTLSINNTDDHLRNHGLLRTRHGWRLSPVFDINPNPDTGVTSATSLAWAATRHEAFGRLTEVAEDFGIREPERSKILQAIGTAVVTWRSVASANGIVAAQQERFAESFIDPREAF